MNATTILGLDFGERRIGVALSDTGKELATGLMTIDCRAVSDPLDVLAGVIREERVESIVVGYPLRTDGREVPGGKTEAVNAFIARLETRFGLPVFREDEAFTSQLAAESLKARGGGRRKKGRGRRGGYAAEKAAIDRVAACYILQDYLDRRGIRP
ncbi:MAG TPA: Holliday junction resolvase RuvX [Fibrobacteria bacterium]|nr:Holliday junction resolvase RuvX [Fibrobacteria bacterium]